ncbi:MAG: hypothetical protein IPJ65_11195 [Archangiaceae bacterium]|nr:hypothetical protein [Archangiaceae bacterium]
MRRPLLACLVTFTACSSGPSHEDDAGTVADAGPTIACDSPEDCKAAGFDGVCRQSVCAAHVPCADDLECGLGEACSGRECVFAGCITDGDCPTGHCRPDAFTCAECGANADCPFDRPICQMGSQRCVQCLTDAQCGQPGPAHCEQVSGTCSHCLVDEHCPNGLTCQGGTCAGAAAGQGCPTGTACAQGLTCVNLGNVPTCLQGCNAFAPSCPTGQICYTLKYSDSTSYVFDMGGLLGVCFTPVQNAKNYRDSCTLDAQGLSNCQPSLACVPDSAQLSSCRAYCDPGALGACPSPEVCHPFAGDFYGREYGLCYADNGFGARCTADSSCRAGQSCQPASDPSATDLLSTQCAFNVGAAPGLAPCGAGRLPDGGTVAPNRLCQSGACRGDLTPASAPYYCYSACESDTDCSVGGRSGTCDGDFSFVNPDGEGVFLTGCRPGCQSAADCSEYGVDGGLACRPRLVTAAARSGLKLNCGLKNPNGLAAGASCATNTQCASGFCSTDDARGVRRLGYCLEACRSGADCTAAADGGLASGPLDCLPTAYLGYRGPDGRAGSPDDALSVKTVCSGVACLKDEDCSADGGARCAPDVSPLDAGSYTLRCRPAVASPREAGGSCAVDGDCASGACGTLPNATRVCFRACDAVASSFCPTGLTCRAGGFRFTSTSGAMVLLDGCAP